MNETHKFYAINITRILLVAISLTGLYFKIEYSGWVLFMAFLL